eukprot:CAMPEP_0170581788 /NCGR_PEP_ID=MMETSP0224-20130122/7229_1 /TAXON_ID=285029 /ORGANISM="Togula jolla, Strain CCCM 725" /LENGTH=72 /DNA_ID=CAMNT_0010904953 /DNA_START=1037 /DNA_END=1252 /DNA_ORIENTATION=-
MDVGISADESKPELIGLAKQIYRTIPVACVHGSAEHLMEENEDWKALLWLHSLSVGLLRRDVDVVAASGSVW